MTDHQEITVARGNDLYFPHGNESGDYFEPLWIASINNGKRYHAKTPELAVLKCLKDNTK